jgi:exopolyphosphatase/guanosine-5'-triphosphate,3'-diphosphate pyrophosphatase
MQRNANEAAEQLSLKVETLSGAQEASAAGYGVLLAIPDADGKIENRVSFPLGVLRIGPMRADRGRNLEPAVLSRLPMPGTPPWRAPGIGLLDQVMVRPPSTTSSAPVVNPEASEAK